MFNFKSITIMKIYHIKQLFMLSACMLAFVACSSDEVQTEQEAQRYPIRLANNLGTLSADDATRASGSYDAGFLSATEFWAWADMTDEGEPDPQYRVKEYISSWFLTVNAADNTKFDTGTSNLFPVYNKLSFYAMHGHFSGTPFVANFTAFPQVLTHRVLTNQTGDGNYLLSDLVYAIKPDVVPQAAPVQLAFQHLLSKIEVALKPGAQMTDAQLKEVATTKVTVSILGTKTGVQFRPTKNADLTTLAGRNSLLTLIDEEAQAITLSTVTTTDFSDGTCASAVVVPQTVNGHFIRLSYQDHDTYFDVTNLELKSGYRYRFNFTVDRIGDTFEVTPDLSVAPWDAEVIKAADLDTLEEVTDI